jgi:TatD DNase family protein
VIVDTHCHLDLRQFDEDREAVIERAAEVGVAAIINPAIDLDSCHRVLVLADSHPNIYAALGVHPSDCEHFGPDDLAELRELARHPKVMAIGEIGLDYYWERVDHEQQERALRGQLALAAELDLPVILHTRNAKDGNAACTEDLLYLLSQWVSEIRSFRPSSGIIGVWHAFSGTLEQAERAYNLGFVLGLGGPVTFQNARTLHSLVPELHPERMILETDAPYLAPHPHRGKRNEPAYLALVVEALAKLTGMSGEEIAAQTTATAKRCFNLEWK